MGSIEPYETQAGRRYRVRYRNDERRQTDKKGFTTKREAELFLAGLTVDIARGDYRPPTAGKANIADLGAAWLAGQAHLKPSSAATAETAWRVHVLPRWGRHAVGSVRHSDVQTWISELSAGTAKTASRALAASSVIRAHGVLAAILDAAVRDNRITSNPARGVKLPRKRPKGRAYLTHQQVDVLAREAGTFGALVLFLAYTGLRWGEATALRVQDLDFLRHRANVSQNAVRVGGRIEVGTPKTHAARSVPWPDFLDDELAAACAGKRREQLVFGSGDAHVQQSTSGTGWFSAAVRRAQKVDRTFPDVTPHDLRHTAASLAISTGANVKAVQQMLGHASAKMTLDVYADLFPDDLDAVAGALSAARSAAGVGGMWAASAERASK